MLQLILAVFLMLTSSLHLLCAVAQGEPAVIETLQIVQHVCYYKVIQLMMSADLH